MCKRLEIAPLNIPTKNHPETDQANKIQGGKY